MRDGVESISSSQIYKYRAVKLLSYGYSFPKERLALWASSQTGSVGGKYI